jgi:hypothetical protein
MVWYTFHLQSWYIIESDQVIAGLEVAYRSKWQVLQELEPKPIPFQLTGKDLSLYPAVGF